MFAGRNTPKYEPRWPLRVTISQGLATEDINGALSSVVPRVERILQANRALTEIDLICGPLARNLSPQFGVFGEVKDTHMRKLAAAEMQRARALDCDNSTDHAFNEALLTVLVARTHDIGRHFQQLHDELKDPKAQQRWSSPEYQAYRDFLHDSEQKLRVIDPQRSGDVTTLLQRNHGLISRWFLEHFRILDQFQAADKDAVLNAIEFHNHVEVPLDKDSVAWRLCYRLRDHDKKDLLVETDYLQPGKALVELARFFIPRTQEAVDGSIHVGPIKPEVWERLRRVARLALQPSANKSTRRVFIDFSPSSTEGLVYELLRGDRCVRSMLRSQDNLKALGDVVAEFEQHKSFRMPTDRPHWSYPLYMLGQLAMVFDIQNPEIRDQVLRSDRIEQRLSYLKRTLPLALWERVETAWNSFTRNARNS